MSDRWTFGETVTLVGKLPDNALNVTVSVWLVDGSPVVTDQPCQQIIISIFLYRFQPAEAGDYVWQMKGTHSQTLKLHTVEGNFSYGGWVDSLLKPEHLVLLAKEATLDTKPTLGEILAEADQFKADVSNLALEVSLIPLAKELSLAPLAKDTTVAKEATLVLKASQVSVDSKPALSQIEASAILAKEASIGSRASQASIDSHRTAVESNIDAKISTRATPADIKTFAVTRILTAPRALELIAKSVSQYYKGQTATLVVMSTYAGAPTDVQMVATIYYPNDTVWKNEEAMTPLGTTGLYTYSFSIPSDAPEGVYKVKYKATKSIAAQELADAFTQADGLPANWTIFQGTWNVVSYVLKQTGTSYAYAHWKDALAVDWADYTFEYDTRADVDTPNFILGIMARYKSSTLAYKFYYSKYRNMLCLDRGTTAIKEKAKTLVWNQWYRFKIELVGATIKCYLDGVLELEWTDLNPVTTGVPTLYCAGVSSFDNVLITIPAQEYVEYEISDFTVNIAPAQETSVQTVLDRIGTPTSPSLSDDLDEIDLKTRNLPTDPASKSDLEAVHGAGSWEGAIEFQEK